MIKPGYTADGTAPYILLFIDLYTKDRVIDQPVFIGIVFKRFVVQVIGAKSATGSDPQCIILVNGQRVYNIALQKIGRLRARKNVLACPGYRTINHYHSSLTTTVLSCLLQWRVHQWKKI